MTMYLRESHSNILSQQMDSPIRTKSLANITEINTKIPEYDYEDENICEENDKNNKETNNKINQEKRSNLFHKRNSTTPKIFDNEKRRNSTALTILGLGARRDSKDSKDAKESTKEHRRSSIALNMFGNGAKDSGRRSSFAPNFMLHNKDKDQPERRSSIAMAILGGRKDSAISKSQSSLDQPEEKRVRRKSWQYRMQDRKRRSGAQGLPPTGMQHTDYRGGMKAAGSMGDLVEDIQPLPRQKRPSWWNIFVPDQLKNRSRRASQDVTLLSRSADNIAPWPHQRSKSRSVDHGLTAPFDLDSLRSKVEGRFESVDRLTKDEERRKQAPPIPTIPYTVGDRDTLPSVAAHFDTTPSELTTINKLTSAFIFSGQVLQVPCKNPPTEGESTEGGGSPASTPTEPSHDNHDDLPPEEKELLDGLRPVSPKPGRVERIKTPQGSAVSDDDPALTQRFLKINVRHITDGQGVVGGVLLVTPNAVMFDPNVSDPLVIEHGPESYGVIAPMDLVVNAAIYHDIAHMRVGSSGEDVTDTKPEIYHSPKSCTHSPGKDSLLVKDETFPELGVGVEGDQDGESVCSCADQREGDAFPKAFERDLVTPTNLQQSQGDSTESEGAGNSSLPTASPRGTLEERRRSLLDHHWAIPSKDRSLENESEPAATAQPAAGIVEEAVDEGALVKQSCHDSGIDIREPVPIVPQIHAKKVYSDADIVLSSDWVPPVTIAPHAHSTDSPPAGSKTGSTENADGLQPEHTEGGRKKTSSVSFSLEEGVEIEKDDKHESKKNKMLKRLSYPLAWVEGLTGTDEAPPSATPPSSGDSHHTSMFSKVFSSSPINLVSELGTGLFLSKTPSEESGSSGGPPNTPPTGRSSIGTFMRDPNSSSAPPKPPRAPAPRLDYRSMVSIDDMPELFVSFDKLIPRPARACADPPLYLRLRMGRPIGGPPPKAHTVMSYGKKKMRPEYWFSVPKNRVDDLYRFLHIWVPQLYGELNEDELRERGYEVINQDTDWGDESPTTKEGRSDSQGEISELSRESWELLKAPYIKIYNILKTQGSSGDFGDAPEVLSMSEELRRALYATPSASLDVELAVPDLVGVTEILSDEHREKLSRHLPARAEGYLWTLVFSTSQHGFSLNSMYRKMQRIESPVLMVIQDTENNVFGALTSCSLKVSDHFYGTGESLLFKFNPTFRVFHWSGENLYFIKGNNESIAIGAGDGKFGLWLDGDLYQGRSQSCSTYANEPLTPAEDFVVKTLECWAFL